MAISRDPPEIEHGRAKSWVSVAELDVEGAGTAADIKQSAIATRTLGAATLATIESAILKEV